MPSLTIQIFIGLGLGVLLGALAPEAATAIKPLADVFLRMIKMIIAPLIFSTLVVGIAGAGDVRSMGRIGLKAMVYFQIGAVISLVLGLALVNVFEPGAGVQVAAPAAGELAGMAQRQQTGWDIVLHMFPTSIFDAMARGDILQVVIFATFFGVALSLIGESGRPVIDFFERLAQVLF